MAALTTFAVLTRARGDDAQYRRRREIGGQGKLPPQFRGFGRARALESRPIAAAFRDHIEFAPGRGRVPPLYPFRAREAEPSAAESGAAGTSAASHGVDVDDRLIAPA